MSAQATNDKSINRNVDTLSHGRECTKNSNNKQERWEGAAEARFNLRTETSSYASPTASHLSAGGKWTQVETTAISNVKSTGTVTEYNRLRRKKRSSEPTSTLYKAPSLTSAKPTDPSKTLYTGHNKQDQSHSTLQGTSNDSKREQEVTYKYPSPTTSHLSAGGKWTQVETTAISNVNSTGTVTEYNRLRRKKRSSEPTSTLHTTPDLKSARPTNRSQTFYTGDKQQDQSNSTLQGTSVGTVTEYNRLRRKKRSAEPTSTRYKAPKLTSARSSDPSKTLYTGQKQQDQSNSTLQGTSRGTVTEYYRLRHKERPTDPDIITCTSPRLGSPVRTSYTDRVADHRKSITADHKQSITADHKQSFTGRVSNQSIDLIRQELRVIRKQKKRIEKKKYGYESKFGESKSEVPFHVRDNSTQNGDGASMTQVSINPELRYRKTHTNYKDAWNTCDIELIRECGKITLVITLADHTLDNYIKYGIPAVLKSPSEPSWSVPHKVKQPDTVNSKRRGHLGSRKAAIVTELNPQLRSSSIPDVPVVEGQEKLIKDCNCRKGISRQSDQCVRCKSGEPRAHQGYKDRGVAFTKHINEQATKSQQTLINESAIIPGIFRHNGSTANSLTHQIVKTTQTNQSNPTFEIFGTDVRLHTASIRQLDTFIDKKFRLPTSTEYQTLESNQKLGLEVRLCTACAGKADSSPDKKFCLPTSAEYQTLDGNQRFGTDMRLHTASARRVDTSKDKKFSLPTSEEYLPLERNLSKSLRKSSTYYGRRMIAEKHDQYRTRIPKAHISKDYMSYERSGSYTYLNPGKKVDGEKAKGQPRYRPVTVSNLQNLRMSVSQPTIKKMTRISPDKQVTAAKINLLEDPQFSLRTFVVPYIDRGRRQTVAEHHLKTRRATLSADLPTLLRTSLAPFEEKPINRRSIDIQTIAGLNAPIRRNTIHLSNRPKPSAPSEGIRLRLRPTVKNFWLASKYQRPTMTSYDSYAQRSQPHNSVILDIPTLDHGIYKQCHLVPCHREWRPLDFVSTTDSSIHVDDSRRSSAAEYLRRTPLGPGGISHQGKPSSNAKPTILYSPRAKSRCQASYDRPKLLIELDGATMQQLEQSNVELELCMLSKPIEHSTLDGDCHIEIPHSTAVSLMKDADIKRRTASSVTSVQTVKLVPERILVPYVREPGCGWSQEPKLGTSLIAVRNVTLEKPDEKIIATIPKSITSKVMFDGGVALVGKFLPFDGICKAGSDEIVLIPTSAMESLDWIPEGSIIINKRRKLAIRKARGQKKTNFSGYLHTISKSLMTYETVGILTTQYIISPMSDSYDASQPGLSSRKARRRASRGQSIAFPNPSLGASSMFARRMTSI